MRLPRVAPIARVNPSGRKVWVARHPLPDGGRRSAGTFEKKGPCARETTDAAGAVTCCAQHASDRAIELAWNGGARAPDTLGDYAATWTTRHPRSERSNDTYDGRLDAVLDVALEGRPLRAWAMAELRRRHVTSLVHVMLTEQGRAASGAQNILRTLSAMTEDAITDEVCDLNPFKGVTVRANDIRIVKASRAPRVLAWDAMHELAAAAARIRTPRHVLVGAAFDGPVVLRAARDGRQLAYRTEPSELDRWRAVYAEALLRTLADCGLRLGEGLPLERTDLKLTGACDERGCAVTGPHLHVRGAAYNGVFVPGDQPTKKHVRAIPLPPDTAAILAGLPARLDTRLLFPTPRGLLWRARNFYRDVWNPARDASGVAASPHDLRHSWVTHLRAAGVDPADLAQAAGHTVETATRRYTHALGRSFDAMRQAVGS